MPPVAPSTTKKSGEDMKFPLSTAARYVACEPQVTVTVYVSAGAKSAPLGSTNRTVPVMVSVPTVLPKYSTRASPRVMLTCPAATSPVRAGGNGSDCHDPGSTLCSCKLPALAANWNCASPGPDSTTVTGL